MLRPEQNTSLRLQQKMAPQLIQSLRLLQMSTLDLTLEVKQQLELNPLLEEAVELREEEEAELIERGGGGDQGGGGTARGHGGGRLGRAVGRPIRHERVQ